MIKTALAVRLLMMIVVVFATTIANAQTFAPVGRGETSLRDYQFFTVDSAGTLSVEEIAKLNEKSFSPLKNLKYIGNTKEVYWTKVNLDLTKFDEGFFFLRKNYQHIGSVTVYYPTANGYEKTVLDEELPHHGRSVWARDHIFRIPVADRKISTYYIRFEPRGHLANIDITFASQADLIDYLQHSQLWIGLFYGSMLVMLFYNALLLTYTRKKAYLYYCYYLASITLLFFDLNGFSSVLIDIRPQHQNIFVLFVYGTMHGATLFTRNVLNLANMSKGLDKYLHHSQWLILAGVIYTLCSSVGPAYKMSALAVLLVTPVLLYSGLLCWYLGSPSAKIYCLGWSIGIFTTVSYCLKAVGLLNLEFITYNLIQPSAAWEAVLFSLALGYQIKLSDFEILQQKEKALAAERMAVKVAESAAAEKGKFLSMVGHELKSPLQGIISALEVLEVKVKADGLKYIYRIRRSTMALSAQLRDLMTFSQAQTGKISITNEKFSFLELVADVMDGFGGKASAKNITLNILGSENDAIVVSDSTRVSQILTNLIGNAIKYTDHGEVSVSILPLDLVGKNFGFRVSDTGCGIPDDQLESIFLPYVRIGSTSSSQEGVGIGLTIVKMLVDFMGGQIVVSSQINIGSTFSVLLPLATLEVESNQYLNAGTSTNILVVDDRDDILDGVESVAGHLGLTCDRANSAANAEKFLSLKVYSFILIDLDMPVKNGFQLAAEIRNGNSLNRNTRLFAFSAGSQDLQNHQWPFSGFLSKPVTMEAIRRIAI